MRLKFVTAKVSTNKSWNPKILFVPK